MLFRITLTFCCCNSPRSHTKIRQIPVCARKAFFCNHMFLVYFLLYIMLAPFILHSLNFDIQRRGLFVTIVSMLICKHLVSWRDAGFFTVCLHMHFTVYSVLLGAMLVGLFMEGHGKVAGYGRRNISKTGIQHLTERSETLFIS